MTSLGAFQPSALGMEGQSHALATISANIANLSTTGYKRADTEFKTLMSRSWSEAAANPAVGGSLNAQADIAGIRGIDYTRVSTAGEIGTTGRGFDLAIAGDGFFTLDTALSGGGERLFSRDGAFSVGTGDALSLDQGYLVDANGYYVQGYPVQADGTSATPGTPGAMRVDSDAFVDAGQATQNASLVLNLPADDAAGSAHGYRIEVYDSTAQPLSLDLGFTKAADANTWDLSFSGLNGETITIEPAAADALPGQGEPLRFDAQGALIGPQTYTVGVVDADGVTTDFSLDLSALTQYAGDFVVNSFDEDGYGSGKLQSLAFDDKGYLVGTFDNGHSRPLYALALADFPNPDGLDARSGTVFAASATSGSPLYGQAGTNGIGAIQPGALEGSNVDLEDQFSRMILTQNAYNSSATAFRTVDEMTETARDLKRG